MKLKLKDGRIVTITSSIKKIPVRAFLAFINALIEEDTYTLHDKKFTY